MKILFIGGNGNISWHCTTAAIAAGYEVWVLNRGVTSASRRPLPSKVKQIKADLRNPASVQAQLGDTRFDVIADFICYTPEQAQVDIDLFANMTRQFIFISSTAAYQKPTGLLPYTESTPLINPYWEYARNKTACEDLFMHTYRTSGFPITIVRPAHTYDTIVPVAVGNADWTIPQRMLDGKPIILHGDGTSLWTVTHSEDFARAFVALLGNHNAIGHAFHITNDEWLTWRQVSDTLAYALNAPPPRYVYVSSEEIAQRNPKLGLGMIGHKTWCDIYDNTKIKSFASGWQANITLREGIKRTIAWFEQDHSRKRIDANLDTFLDTLCEDHAA